MYYLMLLIRGFLFFFGGWGGAVFWQRIWGLKVRNLYLYRKVWEQKAQYMMVRQFWCDIGNSLSLHTCTLLSALTWTLQRYNYYCCHCYWFCYWHCWWPVRLRIHLSRQKILQELLAWVDWLGCLKHLRWVGLFQQIRIWILCLPHLFGHKYPWKLEHVTNKASTGEDQNLMYRFHQFLVIQMAFYSIVCYFFRKFNGTQVFWYFPE